MVQQVNVFRKGPGAIVKAPDHKNYKHRITSGISVTVMTDFGGWKNLFIYEDQAHKFSGIADGADALDKGDNIVAKARLSRILSGEGVEVEEYHYTGNAITFYCKSTFSFGGDKMSETDLKGTRKTDYFPNWPTSSY
jgi:hypothetical protein